MPGPSYLPDETLALVVQVPQPLQINSRPPLPPQPGSTDHVSEPPPISDSDRPALQRLVGGGVPEGQLASLIENIVSNVKAAAIVKFLQESDAQIFIDVMDKVWVALSGPRRTG